MQSKTTSVSSQPEWQVRTTVVGSVASFLLHVSVVALLFLLTFPGRRPYLWCMAVAYYWFLYFRMARFAMWTHSTLTIIAKTATTRPMEQIEKFMPRAFWPNFVIFVPAWGAGQCIARTAAILDHSSYPREFWRVIFVTDEPEREAANFQSQNVVEDICNAIATGTLLKRVSIEHAALILYLADGGRSRSIDYVLLLCTNAAEVLPKWAALLVAMAERGIDPDESVASRARQILSEMASDARRIALRIANDIVTMTGISGGLPSLPIEPLASTKSQATRRVRRELRLSSQEAAVSDPDLLKRLRQVDLRKLVSDTHRQLSPSTAEALDSCLTTLHASNVHHFVRPRGIRNKASALNFAFSEADRRGWLQDDTQVMVLDSDSYVHSDVLAIAAIEILRDPEPNAIRQLLPITTTNFAGRNWLVRTIIAADSIAAPGRWASNVRASRRADLTAGSGVIIPVSLLRHLLRTYGEVWDSKIICEDARMILSQYAVLDGVTKKTKFVPGYVLEGAPEQSGIWKTYTAFWRQRLRWAIGGMDEVSALLRAPIGQMLVRSRDFQPMMTTRRQAVLAMLRRLLLTGAWLKEHLWWSGIAMAPVLWLSAEIGCGKPAWWVRCTGLLLLLGTPLLFLYYVFARRVVPLVPGGVSRRQYVFLFFSLIVTSVLYVLPVIVAQLLCICGVRRRLMRQHWNPATPKPGSQADFDIRIDPEIAHERSNQ